MKFIAGVLTAIAVIVLGGLGVICSGTVNVGASSPHSDITNWLFHTAMQRSVSAHAQAVTAPDKFTDAQVTQGFKSYTQMCVVCHGAPGEDSGEVGKGLQPEPPWLPDVVKQWRPNELFWIVKNGVKMTGMPAFGPTHNDEQIWNIVAFVRTLPDLTEEAYGRMKTEAGAAGGQAH